MDLITRVKRLPTGPGVYLFRDRSKTLYVGKAINLRRRVSSYFNRQSHLDPKTKLLVAQVTNIQTMDTASELDAILLEARLIHEWQPKYNAIARDDKSPLYVIITLSETLPRLVLARKNQLSSLALHRRDVTFGPFQSAKMTRSLLRKLRQVIPFCLAKRRNGKPCFYTHLNLCNPCPSAIVKMPDPHAKQRAAGVYRRHLRQLAAILSGRVTRVKNELSREMTRFADSQEFEKAAPVREQLAALDRLLAHHYDPAVYIDQAKINQDIYEVELTALQNLLRPFFPGLERLKRIECVDIANVSGQAATGSLVVLSEGRINQKEYRHFRVKTVSRPNDTAMMNEVIKRRLNHPEWPLPQLLVVDGGKPQVTAALTATHTSGLSLPIVGLAKYWEEMIIPKQAGGFATLRLPRTSPALHLMARVRDEAHRFARRYYQFLRRRSLTQTLEPLV